MSIIFAFVIIFMLLTLAALAAGLIGMVAAPAWYQRHSNALMRFRVGFQTLGIAAFVVYLLQQAA